MQSSIWSPFSGERSYHMTWSSNFCFSLLSDLAFQGSWSHQLWMSLSCFRAWPYEPLKVLLDRHRTLRCVSFVPGLGQEGPASRTVFHIRSCEKVLGHFAPSFVAQTQDPALHKTCCDEFAIPSLDDFVDGDREKMLLCAVSPAVTSYLLGDISFLLVIRHKWGVAWPLTPTIL